MLVFIRKCLNSFAFWMDVFPGRKTKLNYDLVGASSNYLPNWFFDLYLMRVNLGNVCFLFKFSIDHVIWAALNKNTQIKQQKNDIFYVKNDNSLVATLLKPNQNSFLNSLAIETSKKPNNKALGIQWIHNFCFN